MSWLSRPGARVDVNRRMRSSGAPSRRSQKFWRGLSGCYIDLDTEPYKRNEGKWFEDRRDEILDLLTKNESLVADSFPTLAGMKPSKHVSRDQDRGVVARV